VTGTGGTLRLGLSLDGAALATPPGNPPRIAFGGTFGLDIGANGSITPAADIFAGLPGAASERQAVHLTVGQSIRLFIRPQAGSDISLYPDPPGLGSVASAALQVLPFALAKRGGPLLVDPDHLLVITQDPSLDRGAAVTRDQDAVGAQAVFGQLLE